MTISNVRNLFIAALMLPFIGCNKEPFHCVPVSGIVTYEDGSVIPADDILLTFVPLVPPVDVKTYPRPGSAIVDRTTGEFGSVTTHKAGDGLVRGKHKVTLSRSDSLPLPASVVPREYCSFNKTPLEVDTANLPFVLKVKKPQR
jgi:hypothetical protein